MSWNWSSAKCRRGKSFDKWYNIFICATLSVNFPSKSKAFDVSPKHILKLNTLDKITQARKKLSSSIAHEGAKSNKKHPSWLHCTVVGLSEAASGGFL